MTTLAIIAVIVSVLALVAVAQHLYWYHPKPMLLEASHIGAVLQTLGHKTDIGTSVGAARGTGTTTVVGSGVRVLLGWSLSETAGATAEARLHDGTKNTDLLLTGGVTFAANGASEMWFADEGVEVVSGSICIEVVSGSVRGVVYWG